MCIVVDANMFGAFKDPANENMESVWNWLRKKNGKNSLLEYKEI